MKKFTIRTLILLLLLSHASDTRCEFGMEIACAFGAFFVGGAIVGAVACGVLGLAGFAVYKAVTYKPKKSEKNTIETKKRHEKKSKSKKKEIVKEGEKKGQEGVKVLVTGV